MWSDPDYHRKWREANRDRWNSYSKGWQDRRKSEAIAHYGGKCACCGETEPVFLTIDHLNDDGASHRKTFTGPIYRLLHNEGYPEGYQVLCWNCQWGKRMGLCPHQVNSGG